MKPPITLLLILFFAPSFAAHYEIPDIKMPIDAQTAYENTLYRCRKLFCWHPPCSHTKDLDLLEKLYIKKVADAIYLVDIPPALRIRLLEDAGLPLYISKQHQLDNLFRQACRNCHMHVIIFCLQQGANINVLCTHPVRIALCDIIYHAPMQFIKDIIKTYKPRLTREESSILFDPSYPGLTFFREMNIIHFLIKHGARPNILVPKYPNGPSIPLIMKLIDVYLDIEDFHLYANICYLLQNHISLSLSTDNFGNLLHFLIDSSRSKRNLPKKFAMKKYQLTEALLTKSCGITDPPNQDRTHVLSLEALSIAKIIDLALCKNTQEIPLAHMPEVALAALTSYIARHYPLIVQKKLIAMLKIHFDVDSKLLTHYIINANVIKQIEYLEKVLNQRISIDPPFSSSLHFAQEEQREKTPYDLALAIPPPNLHNNICFAVSRELVELVNPANLSLRAGEIHNFFQTAFSDT